MNNPYRIQGECITNHTLFSKDELEDIKHIREMKFARDEAGRKWKLKQEASKIIGGYPNYHSRILDLKNKLEAIAMQVFPIPEKWRITKMELEELQKRAEKEYYEHEIKVNDFMLKHYK